MSDPVSQRLTILTERERAVFDRVVEGATNKAIAAQLGLSPRTVEAHRGNMMAKLGARKVLDLVRLVRPAGPEDGVPPEQVGAAEGRGAGTAHQTCAAPEQVRIGVMPPHHVGQSPAQRWFAQSLGVEIATALSRFRDVSVMSPRVLADRARDDRDEIALARAHGIAYLLEGTIQFGPAGPWTDWRLVDVEGGARIVRTRRCEHAGEDLARALEAMAPPIAASIPLEVMNAEVERWAANGGAAVPAHVVTFRAIALGLRLDRDGFSRAGAMLEHAIASHPDYAAAHAYRAMWHLMRVAQGWSADPNADAAQGVEAAERAIVLDPHDARSFAIAGHVRAFLGEGLRSAVPLHDRSLDLNPCAPITWGLSALTLAYLGRYREAEERHRRCLALSPYSAFHYYYDSIGCTIKSQLRDYEGAVALGRAAARHNPNCMMCYVPYLSALGHLGDTREAAEVLPRMRAIAPHLTLAHFARRSRFEAAEDREHYIEGLRRAGLP